MTAHTNPPEKTMIETSRSRSKVGLIFVLAMLVFPVFVTSVVESAGAGMQKRKPTPTPQKKATPTKKAKATPTPAKNQRAATKNTKSNTKTNARTDPKKSNAKTDPKKSNTKDSRSKTANSKDKNSRTAAKTTNSKDRNAKTPAKNSRTDKNAANNRTSTKNSKTADPKAAKSNTRTTRPVVEKKQPVAKRQEPVSTPGGELVISSFSVPLRGDARATSAATSKVKYGTVVNVVDRNGSWYKISYSDGGRTKTGWVPASNASEVGADRQRALRQLADKAYKPEMDFGAASELYDLMGDVNDTSGEFELKRLLVLRSALKGIPPGQSNSEPYSGFIRSHSDSVIYNEPAGVYVVASNQFWDLHTKYAKNVVSDSIAWEAAQNPLPGECEGYVNCYLFDMRMRFGEYLNFHPNGQHSAQALTDITNYLNPIVADIDRKQVYNGPTDVTDRAEFNNLIAELRTIVSRLGFVEKERTLQQLRQIAEAYR